MPVRKTMFGPSKTKKYADIMTMTTVTAAKDSARKMEAEFNAAKRLSKKRHIARALTLGANRARASAMRAGLSMERKKQLRSIAQVYETKAKKLWRAFQRQKS